MSTTVNANVTCEKPAQSAAVSNWRLGFLIILSIWACLALLAAYAYYQDLLAAEVKTSFVRQLWRSFGLMLPIAVLNCAFFVLFQIRNNQFLRPFNLSLLLVFLLLIFLPVYHLYELAFMFYRKNYRLPNFAELLVKISFVGVWIDAMLILFAASVQVAVAFLQKRNRQLSASFGARQGLLSLRLKHLQGQLEPSFLLNSLEGVKDLVLGADQAKAIKALVRLSELLRYVLDSKYEDEQVSIADEIHFLKDFLDLQNMRFAERLQIHWQIADENWSQLQSPPLLLHPLIEYALNAMYERLQSEQATIFIVCAIVDKTIQILIRFSGNMNDASVINSGLETAQERLLLLFGTSATLQLIDEELSKRLNLCAPELDLPNGLVLRFPVKLMQDE